MASTIIKVTSSQKVSPSKATNNVHNVLKILSSRLDVEGNIRDSKDVVYITDLMREAVKLVDRCMFLNVLLATKSSTVLTTVLDSGGWGTLHSWLQECKSQDRSSFLIELLKLYKQLPVTVELLRQNTCAKDIKQLAKSPDEQIASSARSIVARWMERVKKASKDAPEGFSSRHSDKASSHKSSSKPLSATSRDKNNVGSSLATKDRSKDNYDDDTDPSRVRTLCDSPDHITAKFNYRLSADRPQRTSDVNAASDDSNSSTSASVDTQDSLTSSSMATSESRRPKTVKMIGNKMRSTGLELDDPLPPTKKKPSAVDKLTISIKPDKLPSIKKATPEKKSPVTTTPPTTATVSAPVEAKPKPKPLPPPKPREVYESSGFMDALGSVDVAVLRRKRKLSANPATTAKSATNATVPSSPDDKKAMPPLNHEAMDTSDESKPCVAKGDGKSGGENLSSETGTSASTEVDMKSEGDKDSTAGVDRTISEDSCSKDSSSQEPAAKKKKVKTVSWVEEQKLCEFFYFQLDENERVNVNKVKDFAETRKHEQEMEKQMMQNVRRMAHDVMAEKVAWKKPRLITGLTSVVVAGANSKERDTQREREQGVLLVIYFNRQTIPDSAAEPEAEFVEYTEPKIIPLTDETGVGTEVSYSVFPAAAGLLPTPQSDNQSMTSLPPAIASLLANTAAAVTAGQPPNIVGFPPATASVAGTGLPTTIPHSPVSNNGNVAPPVLQPPQQGAPPPGAAGPSFNVPPLHVFLSMPLNVQQQIFQSVPFHVQQQMLNSLPPPLQQQLGPLMIPPPGGPGMGPPGGPGMGPPPGGPGMGPPPGGPGPYSGPPPGGVMPPNQQGPYPPPGLLPIPGGPPPNFPPGPMPPPYMGMNGPDVRGPRPPRMMMRGPHHPGRVCTHFLAGNCRYGSSCRNIHPPPDVPPVGHDSPH